MARVIEIVKAHLEAGGFDGLVQVDAECGCLCTDLAPCGEYFSQCEPAYRGLDPSGDGEWAMYRTKEAAEKSFAGHPRKPPATEDDDPWLSGDDMAGAGG